MEPEAVLQVVGTQTLSTYVDMQQATVVEWVVIRPIFDICVRETGYERWRRLWVPWWRHKSEENQLRFTVEEILSAKMVRRRH